MKHTMMRRKMQMMLGMQTPETFSLWVILHNLHHMRVQLKQHTQLHVEEALYLSYYSEILIQMKEVFRGKKVEVYLIIATTFYDSLKIPWALLSPSHFHQIHDRENHAHLNSFHWCHSRWSHSHWSHSHWSHCSFQYLPGELHVSVQALLEFLNLQQSSGYGHLEVQSNHSSWAALLRRVMEKCFHWAQAAAQGSAPQCYRRTPRTWQSPWDTHQKHYQDQEQIKPYSEFSLCTSSAW